MIDLHAGAKDFERFHLQTGRPVAHVLNLWVVKRVRWSHLVLPDGSPGQFVSWWLLGNAIHWYRGTTKCDGSRTRMYWTGQLDDGRLPHENPDPRNYVMTTTEKELFSVRFFVDPGEPLWDNMGGS